MWSVAVLVLLYNMILVMNEDPKTASIGRFKKFLVRRACSCPFYFHPDACRPQMLSAPYVVQIGFSIAALIGSLKHPEHVSRARRFFYCTLRLHPLAMTMSVFTAVMGVAISICLRASCSTSHFFPNLNSP